MQIWRTTRSSPGTSHESEASEASVFCFDKRIQLFRQRLSHKSVKAYATMPIGIMGRKKLALID